MILGRHGSTVYNTANGERIRGFTDLPLDKKGETEAVELATRMEDFNPSCVYSSPLLRARQTARFTAKSLGIPLIVEKALFPWRCGPKIEGQLVESVMPVIRYYADNPHETPEGGEAFSAFTHRFLTFLDDIIQRARQRNKDIALVAHSRCLQLTRAWDAAGRPKDYSYDAGVMNDYSKEVPPGDVMVVETDRPIDQSQLRRKKNAAGS